MRPIIIGFLALMTGFAAAAQETNHVSRTDLASFRVISQRNIFDPTREPRRPGSRSSTSRTRTADAFSLVGIMNYGKGDFAFFDGTNSEYRKIVEPSGAIAGYKVTEISPTGVKLENGKQHVDMKVGTQMRRDEQEAWQLVAHNELPAALTEGAAPTATESASSSSAAEPNDVLKKLMQLREQELK